MTPDTVMSLTFQALTLALKIAGPLLLVVLAVGLLISIFQAATQINEMTLSFIPKLVAMAVTVVLIGPWMLTTLIDYFSQVLTGLPGLAR
jgi:flagellar biosynthetic protein FliQ